MHAHATPLPSQHQYTQQSCALQQLIHTQPNYTSQQYLQPQTGHSRLQPPAQTGLSREESSSSRNLSQENPRLSNLLNAPTNEISARLLAMQQGTYLI